MGREEIESIRVTIRMNVEEKRGRDTTQKEVGIKI